VKTINRILKDLRQFDNLDLYITVTVAIVLAVLNLVGVASAAYLAPLTLAVLGLLALTSLINRHHMDELREALTQPISDFFVEKFPDDLEQSFKEATEVWLYGVSLHRTINFRYAEIEAKLQQGHKFRVLVVHPDGPGAAMAASRNYASQDVDLTRDRITNVLKLLCRLQQIAPERFEVRTIQNPLTHGMVATNPSAASGMLYLEQYTFGATEALPKFVLRAGNEKWYDFFKKEMQAMWDYGVAWKCQAPQASEQH